MIYLSPPDMTGAERAALIAAFDSGWIAPVGPDLEGFEADMCTYLGLGEGCAAALSSGTAGLHLALRLAGVGPGDEVWTSTMTFIATANAVTYQGATPVFLDVDPATWQLDPAVLVAALQSAAAAGRLPAAVVPVDLYGQACDYDPILEVCGRYDVAVIEDAAEGLGATYRGQAAGTLGLAAALSFNGNKLITTSGGGMLVSADADLVAKARYLATQARQPAAHYQHTEAGYNYRLSNLLAALGRAQLGRIDQLIERRRANRLAYERALTDLDGVTFMPLADYGQPNHWLTCILLEPALADPAAVCTALLEQAIEARPLWKPMHQQPVFAGHRLLTAVDPTGADPGPAVADRLFATGMCLPSGSTLTPGERDQVVAALCTALGEG
ncbi:MAG TPA: DegT/DnrJ/EryC1/StrS family aminotransferase [Euzebya sp.]|nr:DegT/DnrJ/EryC1/StrS family aminotransferase [Euzebya sp.]